MKTERTNKRHPLGAAAPVVCVVEQWCRVTGCLHHAEEKQTAGVGQVFRMPFAKNNLRSSEFDNVHESMCTSKEERNC